MIIRRALYLSFILALLAFCLPPAQPVYASTYVVNTTNDNDDGVCNTTHCSLREAINAANAHAGADTITFNIPGSGVHTIQPLTLLPVLTDDAGVTIDGYTQPGAVYATAIVPATLVIELDGSLMPAQPTSTGIGITSANNTIRGLVINRFPASGITIAELTAVDTAEYNTITGNYIGTGPTGTIDLGNGLVGVSISLAANNNTIGGDTPAERNLLSGNGWSGVEIHGSGSDNNTVSGNYIGINAAGNSDLGNSLYGVRIYGGAQNNAIGGSTAGERNIISGNDSANVMLYGANTNENGVVGNYIGTNAAGIAAIPAPVGVLIDNGALRNSIGGLLAGQGNLISGNSGNGISIIGDLTGINYVRGNVIGLNTARTSALPNGANGIYIGQSSYNTIGGDTPAARNIISGNTQNGIYMIGASATHNTIAGNYIGTNPAGTAAIPNGLNGVVIVSGANGNTIGGDAAGAGNVISGNSTNGLVINGDGTDGNIISGNYIGTNAAGTAALGNGERGIYLTSGPSQNTIGGDTAAERNIISGNVDIGIIIDGFGAVTELNTVSGNYIGTDVTGMAALPNDGGIYIQNGAICNIIGGNVPVQGNVISGNASSGISIRLGDTDSNTISYNLIGVGADGSTPLANGSYGVSIGSNASNNTVGPLNAIAHNAMAGVYVIGADSDANRITQNSITRNVGHGIFLNMDANNNIPAPIITGAALSPATVSGTACALCTVEVFASTLPDGEGEVYLGSATANGSGNWTLSPASIPHPYLTATAYNATDGTSEFSAMYLAPFKFVFLPTILR